MKLRTTLILCLISILGFSLHANDLRESFDRYRVDGFTDDEIVALYNEYTQAGSLTRDHIRLLVYAAKNPYAPEGSHAGAKFFEALAWYNDLTQGNKNGKFTLKELDRVFKDQAKKYLQIVARRQSPVERVSAWKMLQKLTLLKREIESSGRSYYRYRAKTLFQVDYENDWNKKNTLSSRADFQKRVIQASYEKPVLIKFGLTYCVHCLLMENLGSVPAVAKKYKKEMDVYKLWWNPKDPQNYGVLNRIAAEQGITSSPMFNLYIDGKLVKSGYAFPDENGDGLEEFLADYL